MTFISTRIRLEFRIVGLSLASVLLSPNPNNLLERLVPLQPSNIDIVPNYTYKRFVVILDRPAFITEPGILFLIENMESKLELGSYGCETSIRRSAGVPEAAISLAFHWSSTRSGENPYFVPTSITFVSRILTYITHPHSS
ncbi:hypothetical protein N7467_002924 [Penicillium canescens]|nr:hypothetical protein N7467_002924 [Penicillium canescens]